MTPQRLSDQVSFLEEALMSSNANYDFVVGHHPIFGTADTLFGTNVSSSNGFADLGNPTAEGTASFAEVLRLIRQYKPVSDGCIIERTHQQPAVNRWSPSGEHHADGETDIETHRK